VTGNTGKIRVRTRFFINRTAGTAPVRWSGPYIKALTSNYYFTNGDTAWVSGGVSSPLVNNDEWVEWDYITATIPASTSAIEIYLDHTAFAGVTSGYYYIDYLYVE
jgi:hypothetical protein